MDLSTILAFTAAFFVFAASPGPDNITIVARTMSYGASSGLAYGAGTIVGILVFLVLAAFGLSVLASKMTILMTILRYGGAAYLMWMGIKLWTAKPVILTDALVETEHNVLTVFATGVLLNLGNPKMPLFYVALLPSVVGAALTWTQVGLLAAVIVGVETLVIGSYVLLATRARTMLRSPKAVRLVNRTAGGVMIGASVAVVSAR